MSIKANILNPLLSRHLLNTIILKCQIHTYLNDLTASKKAPDKHHIQVSRSTEKKCQKKFNQKKSYQLLDEHYNAVTTKKDFSFKWKINFTYKTMIFLKGFTFPYTTSHVFYPWNLPESESRQQHPPVLGEHLKTTVTELLEVPHLGFCVGDSGCYENSLSSHKTFNAFCWLSKSWISNWEDSWNKKILALICICSSYFIAPNTMCVLYRGLRLTVCLWYALRSSDGRCYLNTSNLMLKCLEFPVDICTRALLPSQMKNIWNP